MVARTEPWYIHAALYVIITILVIILVKVAVIDPQKIVKTEKYNKTESRLRMKNIKEAEILWNKKYNSFTDNLDSLIDFIKYDPMVDSIENAFDTLTRRPANPFVKLSNGVFTPDSLLRTPKSHRRYILQIDSSVVSDTVVTPRGKILRIEQNIVKGTKYYLEDPDGYGTVGSLDNEALKNTASWE